MGLLPFGKRTRGEAASDIGAPERIRTSGLPDRNWPLYPAELRGQHRHYTDTSMKGNGDA